MERVLAMKENYQEMKKDMGETLSTEAQYLLEKVETLRDLYEFLYKEEQMRAWDVHEVFGYVLELVAPGTDFSIFNHPSDGYLKAWVAVARDRDPDIYSGHN